MGRRGCRERLRLLADGGSTKTTWLLRCGDNVLARCTTQGLNPFIISEEKIKDVLAAELLTQTDFAVEAPGRIEYYGAGCRGEGIKKMERALRAVFPEAGEVVVGSDLIGAARALLPEGGDGVVCILGTGSNSGLFVGGALKQNVSPLGYILGDEGSGASLGRRFLGDLLKGQLTAEVEEAFAKEYPGLTADEIVQQVYHSATPNRYLASFAPFLHHHSDAACIQTLLRDEFGRFFRRNVAAYARPDLAVSFVGSIAHFFEKELRAAADDCGFRVGRILRTPLG